MQREGLVSAIAAVAVGAAVGIAGFTFVYAQGASYLTNDPSACGNCHIMQTELAGWSRGSHRAVAVCNDCHAPHDLVGKYATKVINGWNHSTAFTFGGFTEPIQMNARNRAITEGACRHCHGPITHALDSVSGEAVSCTRCHAHVGHL